MRISLGLVLAMGCSSSSPSAPADALDALDASVTTPDASPPAPARIAFVQHPTGESKHIYIMEVDASGKGSNPTRLTSDSDDETFLTWSSDGKRLVYERANAGAAIYVINSDGTGELRLSPSPGLDVSPSWSPDGTQIIYARLQGMPQPNQPPPMTDIRIMNADGTNDHLVLANLVLGIEPRWSVQDLIVFMSYADAPGLNIYTVDLAGGGLRRLTNVTGANNAEPVWSHDGAHISFGSDREGNNKLNIFKMDADGGNVEQLTQFDVPYEAGDTSWSSDDKKLAFEWDVNGMKQSDPNAVAEVWTVNADGTDAVTTSIACSDVDCSPRFRP
jgi:Tol biopolymer transport system component